MPICKKCNNKFPNRVLINGITKNVSKRKYCIGCSPFNKHNTRQIHIEITEREKYDKSHRRQKESRDYRKIVLIKLLGGKCEICGYDKCGRSMNFHHIIPLDKKMDLAKGNINRNNKVKVLEEIKKVVLLCSNCHGEVHSGLHENLVKKWGKELLERKTRIENGIGDANILFKFRFVKKHLKTCSFCKKEFTSVGKKKKYCSHKCCEMNDRRVKVRPSIEELGNMIDNMSWVAIGKEYGVSDNAIRKWARQYKLI